METPQNNSVSIILPAFREAGNLRPLVERIVRAISPLKKSYEIIIVDDDSRDGTDRIAAGLASEGLPVRLITRTDQRGLSSAVLCGFHQAAGDILICMAGPAELFWRSAG
jgi:dolichol-phosphate mannosyltransferase